MNKTTIILPASILLFTACQNQQKQDKPQTPNIIYILADDLGYADLGSYGQDKIETPNIDALAANGIRFTQHYTSSPVCAPARCMLLTGQHAGHAQIRGNEDWAGLDNMRDFEVVSNNPNLEGQLPLKRGTQTIGTLLQQAGYKTGIVGKWGLGAPVTDGIPNNQGFDFFYGYNCQRQAHTYFPLHLWKNTKKDPLNNKLVPPNTALPEGADAYDPDSYSDFWLTDYAPELMQNELIQFINDHKDQPFFLYYATPIPHMPLQAPKHWVDYYVKKFGDEKPYTNINEWRYFPHRNPHACYAAMVSYFDEKVGEIVTTLKELGLYENTLIIFSSDNGPNDLIGGSDAQWFDSASPFKGNRGWGKGNLTEGGIRVPMIAQWPGKIEPGTETDLISAHYDVLPTLCEVVGIEPEEKIDGISFLPSLLGKVQENEHDFLYWEFPSSGGQQAVRMGKWKGLRKNIFKNNLDIQLYNLEEDVQEQNDVSAQYPEIVKKIGDIFEQEHSTAENEPFRINQLGD